MEEEIMEYGNVNQYYMGNRLKFKDITSLEWIVERLQKTKTILCDKLISGQEINITINSIESLFRNFVENENDIQDNNHPNNNNPNDPNNKNKFNDIYIIELLFKKREKDIIHLIDPIYLSIRFDKPKLLELFLNEFKYPILPSTFEFSLKNSKLNIIKIILDEKIITLDSNLKSVILKSIFLNPNSSTIVPFILNDLKIFKYQNDNNNNNNNNNIDNNNNNNNNNNNKNNKKNKNNKNNNNNKIEIREIKLNKIQFNDLFKIQSRELQYKMLNNNLVKTPDEQSELDENEILKLFKENDRDGLIFYLNVIYRLCHTKLMFTAKSIQQQQEELKELSTQQLVKLLMIETNSELLYFNYLLEYDDLVDGVVDSDLIVYQYTITVFSVKGLQYLLKKYNNIDSNFFKESPRRSFTDYNNSSEYILRNQNRLIDFLRFYFSKKSLTTSKLIKDWKSLTEFFIKNCDINILTIIFKDIENYPTKFFLSTNCREMNDFKRHQWYIDNVLRTMLETPIQFRYFNRILYNLTLEQEVDYILTNYDFFRYELDTLSFFSFLNELDLAIYFESKVIQLNIKDLLYDRNKIYFQSFINALSIGDLETIKRISPLNLKFNFINTPIPIVSSLIIKYSNLKQQQEKEQQQQQIKQIPTSNFYNSSTSYSFKKENKFLEKLNSLKDESIINTFSFITKENNYQILSNRGFNELVYNLFKRYPIEEIKNLNLNFNQDPYGSLLLAINLIINEEDFINSNFILNQLDITLFKEQDKIQFKFVKDENQNEDSSEYIPTINYSFYQSNYYHNEQVYKLVTDEKSIIQIYNYSVDQIYSFIELIVIKFKYQLPLLLSQRIYQILFNHLYNFYLKINGLQIKDIDRIDRLFFENDIKIIIDHYKIVYYLHAKSLKLGYYILSREDLFSRSQIVYILSTKTTKSPDNVILNEIEFPFQLIKASNYRNLLSHLIKTNESLSISTSSQSPLSNSKISRDILFLLIFGEIDLLFELFSMIKLKLSDNNNNNNNNSQRIEEIFNFKIINCCFQYLKFENCIKLIKLNFFPIKLITKSIFKTGRLDLLEYLLDSNFIKTNGQQEKTTPLQSLELQATTKTATSTTVAATETTTTTTTELNDIININNLYYSFKYNNLLIIKFIFNNFKNILISFDFNRILGKVVVDCNIQLIELIVNFSKKYRSKSTIPLRISKLDILKLFEAGDYKILNYLYSRQINQEIKKLAKRFKSVDYDYLIQNNYFKN
ncbi:hypothetical protein ACTA71_000958 [Dictyostelium dimigraforme]